MKLKRLSLQGYKTFATKTDFQFDNGITAVVGPNGSGKSNIADAVRWVLGEQSFSTLRGKKTTDMIFAGSKSRARAGMAQATLTLDNEDGWLPIDYSEVEICRRAYRSGDNEYILNGQKVRLKDISELLAKGGLAEQTYTIIGQGLIDKALSLKADERRALFEEAAGISHYKSRRASSLRKLQDTQRNLQRVHDILSELKPRLASLKRQANRAQNFLQIQEDLRGMLRIWYGYQWEKGKKEIREARTRAKDSERTWTEERDKLLEQQSAISDLREQSREIEESLQELTDRQEGLREQLESARREVAILKERRSSLERQLEESSEDLPALRDQKDRADSELQLALQELKIIQNDVQQQQTELNSFEKSFRERQQLIDQQKREVGKWERAERQNQTEIAQIAGQLAQLEERLQESSNQDNKGITNEIAQLEKEEKRLLAAAETATSKMRELREERQTHRNREMDLEKEIRTQRKKLDGARRELNQATASIARQQAKVEMLETSRHSEIKLDGQKNILGKLAQFLSIKPEYETVIGLALSAYLDTLILSDKATVWKLAQKRKKNQVLSLFLESQSESTSGILADIPTPFQNDRFIPAREVVTPKPEAKVLSNRLTGKLLITQTAQTAFEHYHQLPEGWTIASMDGLIIDSRGVLLFPRGDAAGSALAAETAYRDAVKELGNIEDRFGELDEQVSVEQKALRELNQELDQTNKERRRMGGFLSEAEQRANRAQRDADKLTQRISFLAQQRSRQSKEQDRLKERQVKLNQALEVERSKGPEITEKLEAARKGLEEMPVGEVDQQRRNLKQQIAGNRSILDGRRAIADSRRATMSQVEKQIARLEERRKAWSVQLMEINLDKAVQRLERLEREQKELTSAIKPKRETLQELNKARRRQESDMAPQQKVVHTLETQFTQSKIGLTQKETQIENLKERIKSELGIVHLSYDEDQTGDTPLPLGTDVVEELPQPKEVPDGLDDQIQKMRSQLSRMGAVNPEAPVEYESVRERHDFLETQIEDLNNTEIHLREVIDELDELTSKAFAETVTKVNEVFGNMFTRLFGGGSADLSLTDPDDLTVSGVDITAQLPGRRPQGLALLSGGERSLTAASLIFALLKVSPTPFCVMDEVDAALDEANVNRFRDVLHELSEDTQFIVITHNRGTVQAAKTIYGITMGTDSTSQAISVKPEEYLTQPKLLQ